MPRLRKSDALHTLNGTTPHDRSTVSKVSFASGSTGSTRVPRELKGNKIATQEWKRITALLDEANLLKDTDRSTLLSYTLAYSRMIQAEAEIAKTGLMVQEPIVTRSGNISGYKQVVNPLVRIARQERESMARLAARFGLSVKDRQSIPTPEKPKMTSSQLLAAIKQMETR